MYACTGAQPVKCIIGFVLLVQKQFEIHQMKFKKLKRISAVPKVMYVIV